jgi:hypothetical protein
MKLEHSQLNATVRQEYQVLLRAHASLQLPTEHIQIRDFYTTLGQKCIHWAKNELGEQLREVYLQREDSRARARMRTVFYRLEMTAYPCCEQHWVILCESSLSGNAETMGNWYYRLAHVWNVKEQTILPPTQVMRLFPSRLSVKKLPFSPDGIYPQDGQLIFYRNQTATHRFFEEKVPMLN